MKSLLIAALALLVAGLNPAAAATPDLHDASATYEAFKSSQQTSYEAVDAQYRAAMAAAPDDVELAIARCRFIENFSYAEDIDWSEAAGDALDRCRGELEKRWPDSPPARVFRLDYATGEEAIPLAEKAWRDSSQWPKELRARIAAHLHGFYEDEDPRKAGRYAVIAARLGDSDTVVPAITYLAGKGENAQAVKLARDSEPATSSWMASRRVKALATMGDTAAARHELDRSLGAGLEISAASQVQAYLADHDLKAANKAALNLGPDAEATTARFELALANGDVDEVTSMVDFEDGFETWIARYSTAVALAPAAAFTSLLAFTLAIALGLLAFALLPGLLLVPVHYRGLMRRVRDRAPVPMFEGIGLRHAWIAGSFIIVIPALVLLVMRPDAIGSIFLGGEESGSTQFSVVAVGMLLTWVALLPWQRRLYLPPTTGRHPLSLRTAGVVVAGWGVIYAIGLLSALVYQASIGGDSSTLQTRTVEALVENSSTQYGVLVTLLLIAGLVPVVEELVFRGMLLGGLSRHISFGWANALQSLLFASIHGDPPRFLVYTAVGWIAGWLTRRYGSLLPAIALHALNNAIATWMHG